jgi:hypothetical protein
MSRYQSQNISWIPPSHSDQVVDKAFQIFPSPGSVFQPCLNSLLTHIKHDHSRQRLRRSSPPLPRSFNSFFSPSPFIMVSLVPTFASPWFQFPGFLVSCFRLLWLRLQFLLLASKLKVRRVTRAFPLHYWHQLPRLSSGEKAKPSLAIGNVLHPEIFRR